MHARSKLQIPVTDTLFLIALRRLDNVKVPVLSKSELSEHGLSVRLDLCASTNLFGPQLVPSVVCSEMHLHHARPPACHQTEPMSNVADELLDIFEVQASRRRAVEVCDLADVVARIAWTTDELGA